MCYESVLEYGPQNESFIYFLAAMFIAFVMPKFFLSYVFFSYVYSLYAYIFHTLYCIHLLG